ncbi:MAG: type I methionyl aminopeptidase [Puniceicoccales bacterium]|jgi:methionyl aminopeptidase|nr:type I methionyl aminopeptidase [Puniceicoccales bacterium]
MICRTDHDLNGMRKAGEVAAKALQALGQCVRAGVSTSDLNEWTHELMAKAGAVSATYGYKSSRGSKNSYPGYACFSVNDVIVHGIPSKEVILKEGDIISIDLALFYEGFCGDNTVTLRVGQVTPSADRLIDAAEEALRSGIQQAISGNYVEDISRAIETVAHKAGYGVVREFVGHGVGRKMHEYPQIPNYVIPCLTDEKVKLCSGMTLAIEPMLTAGNAAIQQDSDGWTVRTKDGSLAAHVEHTILVTKNLPEILTLR